MAGDTERCMYCSDSVGTDIEHFWPKAPYPERMFEWQNLLLCCSGCGTFKGSTFPLSHGDPLLVDPCVDDPWLHIDFNPETGILTALGDSEMGKETVAVLRLDERDGVNRSYRKSYRRIEAVLRQALDKGQPKQLLRDLEDADDVGLLGWCFRGNGQRRKLLQDFRVHRPIYWAQCVAHWG
jgi:uncharacterized protein (TIGR02646 family)